MKGMTRREAREAVFGLLFETEFQSDREPQRILELAQEDREIGEDAYVQTVYLGVLDKQPLLDAMIGSFSKGWKTDRLSRVSRAVLRLCTYEMLYCEDIPANVSMNEAVELTKRFDDPKARSFVNGVINSIKNDIADRGKEQVIAALEAQLAASGETAEA